VIKHIIRTNCIVEAESVHMIRSCWVNRRGSHKKINVSFYVTLWSMRCTNDSVYLNATSTFRLRYNYSVDPIRKQISTKIHTHMCIWVNWSNVEWTKFHKLRNISNTIHTQILPGESVMLWTLPRPVTPALTVDVTRQLYVNPGRE